jgi:aspartyl-tRNA(Asn)/glutamyl-tRNA(Gln) amidotransferase subunit A
MANTDKRGLESQGLCEIAEGIRRGEFSCTDVLESIFAAVDERNPAINAFIWQEREQSLAEAAEYDKKRPADLSGKPLFGVPLAHKDMYYQAGRLATCGSEQRAAFRPGYTATVIERLEAAGSITFGGLNMAEFAQNATGHNVHFGNCRNPWDNDYVTGGSSSGSGAAVAARLTYASLGSDTAGSIRLPASLCGVTGLKTTWSRVSRYGVMPMSFSCDTVGPLARSAKDCAQMLQVIAGRDPLDPTSAEVPVRDYLGALDGDVRGLRIGVPYSYFFEPVDDEIARAFDEALAVLVARGAVVKTVMPPHLDAIAGYMSIISRVEAATIGAQWMREAPDRYAPHLAGRLYLGAAVPAVAYIEALSRRGGILRDFGRQVFSEVDVVMTPMIRIKAPTIAESDADGGSPDAVKKGFDLLEGSRPVNYLGVTAVSMPCGFDGNGLPIGAQVIGRPFDEDRVLKVADAFQRDTDWHRRPPF